MDSIRKISSAVGFAAIMVLGASCSKDVATTASSCAPTSLSVVADSTGSASVLTPDPLVASGLANLSVSSPRVDDYRRDAGLAHLGGYGVLEGQYVDVRDEMGCEEWFGAYDPKQSFHYSRSDRRFQEVMAYAAGDEYRSKVDDLGYLPPGTRPTLVLAHCMNDDNAFFTRLLDDSGVEVDVVCLGDSVSSKGASYADDGIVVMHELQHATTTALYSQLQDLNQYFYDEAGSLNEAVSDFVSLAMVAPQIPATLIAQSSVFDPRIFSRWALGLFSFYDGRRGSHKCPAWDPGWPSCAHYPAFSPAGGHVSYVYPDGLGWPYGKNFSGSTLLKTVFQSYSAQEEIHNAGVLLAGALWDVRDALVAALGEDDGTRKSIALALEAIKSLPKPSSTNRSPVTFRGYGTQLLAAADRLSFTPNLKSAVEQALRARGLVGGTLLGPHWLGIGNKKIVDGSLKVKAWALEVGGSKEDIPQDVSETGLNGRLDPDEVALLWFDLQNQDAVTAGGIQLTLKILDPGIEFMPYPYNRGYLSKTSAQVRYGKVNGSNIVASLTQGAGTAAVPTGTSYFLTDPYFGASVRTAVWVRVLKSAAHGSVVRVQLDAEPSNGPTASVETTLEVN